MKFLIKLITAISLVFTIIPTYSVNAESEDDVIEKELATSIISGNGTAESPYIVDYDKAPHFKKYMDKINDKVMLSLQGESLNENISTYGIYDGILVGKAHYSQNKGGYWYYKSGAPSTTSNGNIWMHRVEYVSIEDTKTMQALLKNSLDWGIVEDHINSIVKKPYDDALEELVMNGIESTTAKSFLKAAGFLSNIHDAGLLLKFINDCFVLSNYNEAVRDGDGMIKAIYSTSYQGSWYEHTGEDTWTTANTAYEPSSYYGTGSYGSH